MHLEFFKGRDYHSQTNVIRSFPRSKTVKAQLYNILDLGEMMKTHIMLGNNRITNGLKRLMKIV